MEIIPLQKDIFDENESHMKEQLNEIRDYLKSILEYKLTELEWIEVSINGILEILILIIIARIVIWILKKWIYRMSFGRLADEGRKYTIHQISEYIVYTILIVTSLHTIGIDFTTILAAETALFVGIGLGLQDAFKDLSSGIIILMERTMSAGDIIKVGDEIGRVEKIGIRTTTIRNRDDVLIILPNHCITNESIINLTLNNSKTRFSVNVGVEYGSDIRLVREILIASAENVKSTVEGESRVILSDFGDSSINFELVFFTMSPFSIELIKSEIRFEIDQKFRENGVVIPFPQRTLTYKDSAFQPKG